MIKYTVVWRDVALNDLADIWLVAADRAAVTAASHAIERELSVDAPQKAVERHEGLMVFTIDPLKVAFEIREDDRVVDIYFVGYL